MKEIRYTSHAEERLNERFISKQDVENAVRNEEYEEAYGDKLKAVHKINGKEIEVILKPENDKILIYNYLLEVKSLNLSFDPEADAVYIELSQNEIKKTEKVDDRTMIDIDEEGEISGIEILDAKDRLGGFSELNIDFADSGEATV